MLPKRYIKRSGRETASYVSRLLAAFFADNEAFSSLQAEANNAKEPLRMRCGNQLCVNLNHIAMPDD